MNKVKANLIKAIEDKTNAYQRLSVKDIADLSQALNYIAEAEVYFQSVEKEKVKAEREKVEMKIQRMYGCDDELAIGFCDWG